MQMNIVCVQIVFASLPTVLRLCRWVLFPFQRYYVSAHRLRFCVNGITSAPTGFASSLTVSCLSRWTLFLRRWELYLCRRFFIR
jgi:hypothetical protein